MGIEKYINNIENLDLSVFEMRLLIHIQNCIYIDGKYSESVRSTAKKCHMSTGQVVKTRNKLTNRGIFEFEIINKYKGGNSKIIIKNIIFSENFISNQRNESINWSPDDRDGYIYLLKASNNLYKIGKSLEIISRSDQIIKQSPLPIELIHYFKSTSYSKTENLLHQKYSKFLHHGEWFLLGNDEIKEICNIKDNEL